MEYKPQADDIKFAKQIYDEVIWTQTLNPNAIRAAYKRLFGHDAITTTQAKIKISAWFQYTFKPSMLDQTEAFAKNGESDNQALPKNGKSENQSLSICNEGQTHQEDFSTADSIEEEISDKPKRKRNKKN